MSPVTLDVETARRVGWSDETIAHVAHTMYLAVRGANLSEDFVAGRACEACGRATPRHPGCAACTGDTRGA